MPYKDRELKRARDQERYKRLQAGGEHSTNPLTADEWRALQRHVGCTGGVGLEPGE